MNHGERRAARHYLLRGWRVVGANECVGRNEIDLIVRRGRRLIVVEVKEKTGDRYGDPLEMVDAEKLRRVRRTAQAWLARNGQGRNRKSGRPLETGEIVDAIRRE